MVNVQFFASIREALGVGSVKLDLSEEVSTIEGVLNTLCDQNPGWEETLKDTRVLSALNQEMIPLSAEVSDGDEVAFFPPVTGG